MHHSNFLMLLIYFHSQNINHLIKNMLEFSLDDLFFLSKDLSQFYNLFLNVQITANLIFFIVLLNQGMKFLKSLQISLMIVYIQTIKLKPKNIFMGFKIKIINFYLVCISFDFV